MLPHTEFVCTSSKKTYVMLNQVEFLLQLSNNLDRVEMLNSLSDLGILN